MGLWQEKDFTKVPTRKVYGLYQTYNTLPKGEARLNFRVQHPELDAWLVYAKGYTYASDAAKSTSSKDYLAMGFPSPRQIISGIKSLVGGLSQASQPQVSGDYTTPREMPLFQETFPTEELGEPSEASISRLMNAYGFTHEDARLALASLNKVDFTYQDQEIDTEGQLFSLIGRMSKEFTPHEIMVELYQAAWKTKFTEEEALPPVESPAGLQQIKDFLASSNVSEQQYIPNIHDCKQFTSDLLWEASRAGLPIGAAIITFNNAFQMHRIAWFKQDDEILYIDAQTDEIFTQDELNNYWQPLGGIQSINRVSPSGGFAIETVGGGTEQMSVWDIVKRISRYSAGALGNVFVNLLEMYVIRTTEKAMDWKTWAKVALGIIL
jgi:hypothetical protein